MKRSLAIILALTAVLALASCGSSDDSSEAKAKKETNTSSAAAEAESSEEESTEDSPAEPENITGETKEWGDASVLVPEGFEFKGGDVFDENDTRYFSVKKSIFDYFDFVTDEEDRIMSSYNYNKKTYTNGQKDLPAATYGEAEWNGFEYDAYGIPAFEAYTKIGERSVRVSSTGFKFDDPVTKAVLESLAFK